MLVCSCKNTNKYRNKEEKLGKIKKYLLFNLKEGLAHTICTSPSLYIIIYKYLIIYILYIAYLVSENLMLKPKSCVVVG